MSKRISNKINKVLSQIDFEGITATFKELGELFEALEDNFVDFKKIIVELGYPPRGELPFTFINQVVLDYHEHGAEYVKNYLDKDMCYFYNSRIIESFLLNWHANSILESRLPILRNVVKCHKQKMYYASVTGILPQLEGIIAESFNHKGKLDGEQLRIYLQYLLVIPENELNNLSLEDAFRKYYLQYILVSFKHGQTIHSEISRHAILHGGHIDYGHEENSLKLILLFDFLADCLSDLKEEVIEQAKESIQHLEESRRRRRR